MRKIGYRSVPYGETEAWAEGAPLRGVELGKRRVRVGRRRGHRWLRR